MVQDKEIIESFQVLDVIKIKLNEILITGIDSIGNESNFELAELKNKLAEMNFTTLSDLLGSLLDKMKELSQKTASISLKKEISIEILRMIAVTRMLEKIMTLESVKKTLEGVE